MMEMEGGARIRCWGFKINEFPRRVIWIGLANAQTMKMAITEDRFTAEKCWPIEQVKQIFFSAPSCS
jgi:hypothetical protein